MPQKEPLFKKGDKVDFFTMPWGNTRCVIDGGPYPDAWEDRWFYSVWFPESQTSFSPAFEDQLKPIVEEEEKIS